MNDYVYNFKAFDTIELPEGVQMIETLPDGNELKEYARNRGILGLYPLLHINDISNRKRIVVPFTYNSELVGWTARHINPPDKETPKYLQTLNPAIKYDLVKNCGHAPHVEKPLKLAKMILSIYKENRHLRTRWNLW